MLFGFFYDMLFIRKLIGRIKMSKFAEHKLWLLDDGEDSLRGALVEMSYPIVSNLQWQAFLDNLLSELVNSQQSVTGINGTYAISFSNSSYGEYVGMVVMKLEGEDFDSSMSKLNLPTSTLGLLHILDEETHDKIGIISLLAGDYSDKGDFTPNRILASAAFGSEVRAVRKNNVSPDIHQSIMSFGKVMLNHLDTNLVVQGFNN